MDYGDYLSDLMDRNKEEEDDWIGVLLLLLIGYGVYKIFF